MGDVAIRELIYPRGILDNHVLDSHDMVCVDSSCSSVRGSALAAELSVAKRYGVLGRRASCRNAQQAVRRDWAEPGGLVVCSPPTRSDLLTAPWQGPEIAYLFTSVHERAPGKEGSSTQRLAYLQQCLDQLQTIEPRPKRVAFALPEGPVLLSTRGVEIGVAGSQSKFQTESFQRKWRSMLKDFAQTSGIQVSVIVKTSQFTNNMQSKLGVELELIRTAAFAARKQARLAPDRYEREIGLALVSHIENTLETNILNVVEGASSAESCAAAHSLPASISGVGEGASNLPKLTLQQSADILQQQAVKALTSMFALVDKPVAAKLVVGAGGRIILNLKPVKQVTREFSDLPPAIAMLISEDFAFSDSKLRCGIASPAEYSAARRDIRDENDAITESYRAFLRARKAEGDPQVAEAALVKAFSHKVTSTSTARSVTPNVTVVHSVAPSETTAQCLRVSQEGNSSKFTPDAVVSSSSGPHLPAKLLTLKVVSPEYTGAGTDPDSVCSALVSTYCTLNDVIDDSGSATTLLGANDAEEWERRCPGCIKTVRPILTSVQRIKGIGPNAMNLVLRHVEFTLDIGGALIKFTDVPVLNAHSGLLLGNEFAHACRIVRDNAPYTTPEGTPADGFIILRRPDLTAISAPVPFIHRVATLREAEVISRMQSQCEGDAASKVSLAMDAGTADKADRIIESAVPIAYAPRTIKVPAWSEMVIMVRVPAAALLGHDLAVLPLEDERLGDLGVLLAPVLTRPNEEGYIPVRVINPSLRPVIIPVLTPVGRFIVDPRIAGSDIEFTTEEIMQRINIDADCSEKDLELIRKMIEPRRRIFASTLGWAHGYQYEIKTPLIDQGKALPPAFQQRKRSPEELTALEAMIKKQLRLGLIESVISPYGATPMLIKKPGTTDLRVVLDYRALNALVEGDVYPLPNIENNLSALGNAKLFTTADLLMGFHQVELTPDSVPKTALNTPFGQFAYRRLPMGLTSAPSAFMRLVDASLRGLPPGIAMCYVDDLITFTDGNMEEHMRDVGKVFDKLVESGFTVKCEKVHVGKKEVPYLGFLAGAYGTRPDPAKTRPILDVALESIASDPVAATRYVGMLGHYRRFLPGLQIVLKEFSDLRSSNANTKEILGSLRFRAAFEHTKYMLTNVTALARPDMAKLFYVDVDSASSNGIGAILTQRTAENDPESHMPIAFYSRRFNGEERGYGVRDQECLGVIEALEEWRPYLGGGTCIVRTDHMSLKWLLRTRHMDGSRVAGYALKAQNFNIQIQWVPGKEHGAPDFFSREKGEGEGDEKDIDQGDRPKVRTFDDIHDDLEKDKPLARVYKALSTIEESSMEDTFSSEDYGDQEQRQATQASSCNELTRAALTTVLEVSDEIHLDDPERVAMKSLQIAIRDATTGKVDVTTAEARAPVNDSRRASPRVAALFLRQQKDNVFEVMVERQGDVWNLLHCDVDRASRLSYREQLSLHAVSSYVWSPTSLTRAKVNVLALLVKNSAFHKRWHYAEAETVYFSAMLDKTQNPVQFCQLAHLAQFYSSVAQLKWRVLDDSLLLDLAHEDDFCFASLFRVQALKRPIVSKWQCNFQNLLRPQVLGLDNSLDLSYAYLHSLESDDSLPALRRPDEYSSGYLLPTGDQMANSVQDIAVTTCCATRMTTTEASGSTFTPEGAVPSILQEPRGPAFIQNIVDWEEAARHLCERWRKYPELSISVDLEGALGGQRSHISLIQLAIDAPVAHPEVGQLIYVFDTHVNRRGLMIKGPDSLRALLEETSARKILHCCNGDAAALYYEYGIKMECIFDTGIADCLLRGRHWNRPRNLEAVMRTYMGEEAIMQLKGSFDFVPGMFNKRPLEYKLFVYSYEDVIFCNRLFEAQRSLLQDRGLLELCFEFSGLRAPPRSLPVSHPSYLPAGRVAIALVDASSVVCLQSLTTGLCSLPEDVLPGYDPIDPQKLRPLASEVWRFKMGTPPRYVRQAVNAKLQKPIRIGDTLLFRAQIPHLERVLESLLSVFQGTLTATEFRLVLRDRLDYVDPAIGTPTEQRPFFQYLHLDAESALSRAPPAAITSLSSQGDARAQAHITVLGKEGSVTVRVGFAALLVSQSRPEATVNVVVGPVNTNKRAALLLTDGLTVYALRTVGGKAECGAFMFPSHPVEVDAEPLAGALKAFDLYAGSSIRRAVGVNGQAPGSHALMPELSVAVTQACEQATELGLFGNTYFFAANLAPFLQKPMVDYLSNFYAARREVNGFRLTKTLACRYDSGVFLADVQDMDFHKFDLKALEKWRQLQYNDDGPEESARVFNISTAVPLCQACVGEVCPKAEGRAQYNDIPPLGEDSSFDALFEARVLLHVAAVEANAAALTAECNAARASESLPLPLPSNNDTDAAAQAPKYHSPSVAEILEEQLRHPFLNKLHAYHAGTLLSAGPVLASGDAKAGSAADLAFEREAVRYHIGPDGLLMRRSDQSPMDPSRIVLPHKFHTFAFTAYHDRQAHLGLNCCWPLLTARFWWDNVSRMKEQLGNHIRNCRPCTLAKVPHHSTGEMQIGGIGHHPMDVLSVDTFTPGVVSKLPDGAAPLLGRVRKDPPVCTSDLTPGSAPVLSKTSIPTAASRDDKLHAYGYDRTVDWVCHFSKGVISSPAIGDPSSEEIAYILVREIIRHFGTPRAIRSDRGSAYISAALKALYKRYGIKVLPSSSYHHQSVALVERWHGTLKQLLTTQRIASNDNQWHLHLPLLELAFNATVSAVTGFSPFFVMYLRHAVLPTDMLNSEPSLLAKDLPEWVSDHLQRLRVTYDVVSHTLRTNSLHQKKKYDLRRDVNTVFKPGDRVVLIKGRYIDKNLLKGEDPIQGPYTVERGLPRDRYQLTDLHTRRMHNVVHVSRLKRFPDRVAAVPTKDSNLYPISGIVGRRVVHTADRDTKAHGLPRLEYCVKWLGFGYQKSWRSIEYLTNVYEMVAAYNRQQAELGNLLPAEFEPLLPTLLRSIDDLPPPPPENRAIRKAHFRPLFDRKDHSTSVPKPDSNAPDLEYLSEPRVLPSSTVLCLAPSSSNSISLRITFNAAAFAPVMQPDTPPPPPPLPTLSSLDAPNAIAALERHRSARQVPPPISSVEQSSHIQRRQARLNKQLDTDLI